VALKENIDVAGWVTRGGTLIYDRAPAEADAPVVARLRAAGCVLVGHLRMQELAFGGWGTHAVTGTPRNPWDLTVHRVPGGSSSGAGVATAARLVPASIGTDTGGSVRIPATVCGLVGLKPTLSQIPREGILPLARSLDSVGPLTVCVDDAAWLYDALAGLGAGGEDRGVAPRIGLLPPAELEDTDPDVLAGLRAAEQVLTAAGASFTELEFGMSLAELVEKNGVLSAVEGWQAHGAAIAAHPDRMDPAVLRRFLRGREISAAAYADALREQLDAQERAQRVLAGVDALLIPGVPLPAIPLTEVDENVLPFNRYTRAANFLGLCALSLPSGLSRGGLPVGVQLVGAPDTERRLLALGRRLETGLGRLPPPDLAPLGLT
jgi:aspartyl-tRNA(Asn)/glutamyl-tRNA(Gln) amidotransferase subunit A